MYNVALSVSACVKAGTQVDVAWIVNASHSEGDDPAEAVAFTSGGGRLGSLVSGALDGQLVELAGIQSGQGRLVHLDIGPNEAVVAGVEPRSGVSCLLVRASELPAAIWPHLLDRNPVCLVSQLDDDIVTDTALFSADTIGEADEGTRRLFGQGSSTTEIRDDAVVTVFWPTSTLAVVGQGEIADALCHVAAMLRWRCVTARGAGEASGVIAGLSSIDSVVVLGHDLEIAGGALMAALESTVGYIGGVGPTKLHESRSDWLAYRGFTDLSRVHAPAGLEIGARNSQEIALAICAEIVASQAASTL